MRNRSAQEGDGGDGLLVLEHLDVGQAGRVVDADMDVLPADGETADTSRVGATRVVVRAADPAADEPLAGAVLDPASLRVFLCIGGWLGVVGDAVSEVDA